MPLDDAKTDTSAENTSTLAPLHEAAKSRNLDDLKQRIEKQKLDVNTPGPNGWTALHYAAENGDDAMVGYLLEHKANPNALNAHGSTPFLIAVQNGHLKACMLFAKQGIDVHAKNKYGTTPLHIAATTGKNDIIRWLILTHHVDPNTVERQNCTALHFAAMQGHLDTCKLLVTFKADIQRFNKFNENALDLAVLKGRQEVVEYFLSQIDINTPDPRGKTALHIAAENGNESMVAYLLSKGADVSAQDTNGNTPLHLAAYNGHKKACQLLVDNRPKRAKVDAKNNGGNTPFLLATKNNQEEIALWLMDECHVDIDTQGIEQNTALNWSNASITAHLLARGAKPSLQNAFGSTPLHRAVDSGNMGRVTFLLQAGASLDIRAHPDEDDEDNAPGKTPLELAEAQYEADSPMVGLLKNFTKDKTIIQSMYKIAHPILTETLDGLLIPALQQIIFGNLDQQSTQNESKSESKSESESEQNKKNPEITKDGFVGFPEGKVIEVAEQCLLDFAQKKLSAEKEIQILTERQERLLNESPEQKNKHLKEFVKFRTNALRQKIEDLTQAALDIIRLVPFSDDCEKYWETLQTQKLFKDLEKVQQPSKLPPLNLGVKSEAKYEKDGKEEKQSTASVGVKMEDDAPSPKAQAAASGNKEKKKPRAIPMDTSRDTNPDRNSTLPASSLPTQNSTSHSSSSSSSSPEKKETKIDIHLYAKTNKNVLLEQVLKLQDDDTLKLFQIYDLDINAPADTQNNTLLHLAAKRGDLDQVKYLILHGADISAKTTGGWTALHQAANNGHTEVARYLLEQKADVHAKDSEGCTPLHVATIYDHTKICELLIMAGANVNEQTTIGTTAIFMAAEYDLLGPCKLLVERKANINLPDNDNDTPVFTAVAHGSKKVAAYLIEECKADVTIPNIKQWTALHYAAGKGDQEICTALIEHKANVHARNELGETPLHLAADNKLELVQYLIDDHKADVDSQNLQGWRPLHYAIQKGDETIVRFLLDRKADVNAPNIHGCTPLNLAIQLGHLAICKLLVERGANVHVVDKHKHTILHKVAIKGDEEMMQYFLQPEHKLDVNAQDENGNHPIHTAVINGSLAACKLLAKHGGNLNARNNTGDTVCHAAAWNGKNEIITWLITSQKIDVNSTSKNGTTALMSAAQQGHVETCKLLVSHKADTNHTVKKNGADYTALTHAVIRGHQAVSGYLLSLIGIDTHIFSGNRTALHIAAELGDEDMVTYLLSQGADVSVRNSIDDTPLHSAAKKGHKTICQLLLDNQPKRAKVDARNYQGYTPFHLAVFEGKEELALWLMDKCYANIENYDIQGFTPLHIANTALTCALLKRGADTTLPNRLGHTPLYNAAHENNLEKAKLLLQAGADPYFSPQFNPAPANPVLVAHQTHGEASNIYRVLANFSYDQNIIEAIHEIAQPILSGFLDGILIPNLKQIIFGNPDQQSTQNESKSESKSEQNKVNPEITKYGYFGCPTGKVIEVAERYLLDIAKEKLSIEQEKEKLEKELAKHLKASAEQRNKHVKEFLKFRTNALSQKIKDLTQAALDIITLVPFSDDCEEYWNELDNTNTIEALEKVQQPSKLPPLNLGVKSEAKYEKDGKEEKQSTASVSVKMEDDAPSPKAQAAASGNKEEEKPRAIPMDTSRDTNPDRNPTLPASSLPTQNSTSHSSSSSSSSSVIAKSEPAFGAHWEVPTQTQMVKKETKKTPAQGEKRKDNREEQEYSGQTKRTYQGLFFVEARKQLDRRIKKAEKQTKHKISRLPHR